MLGSSPVRPRSPRVGVAAFVSTALVLGLAATAVQAGRAEASTKTAVRTASTIPDAPLGERLAGDTAQLTQGVGSWVGTNTAPLAPLVWTGGGALVVKAAAAGTSSVQTGTTAIRVTPGQVYSGKAQLAAATAGRTTWAALAWYDATGREITSERTSSALVTDAAGSWAGVLASGIAPASASYVSFVVSIVGQVAGETHYLASPSLVAGAAGSRGLVGPLHTTGNKIYDANNGPVVLRGVNRYGTLNPATDNISQYEVSRIKAWGGNVVRLTLNQDAWLPGCPAYNPNLPAQLDQAISWINDAKMLAILDLQWSAPTCATSGLNPMPDANSLVFWQQVAPRYANRPLVAFDLFNEPHDVSDAVWADGGAATTASGVSYAAVGMKTLYDAVRRTGARNLVFLGGLGYASIWPTTAPLAGTTNVVYAVHAYNCDTPATCVYGTGISWLLDRFVVPGQTNPIMVTEFGWPAANRVEAQTFNNNVIAYAEAHGWGWMPWTWVSNGNCNSAAYWDLVATGSCAAGGTYQPSPAGMPILTGLRKNS